MTRKSSSGTSAYLWGISLRQAILLTFLGTVIAFYKALYESSLHVPGHSGLIWMALLVIGRGVVPKRYAATYTGLIAGLLSVIIGHGRDGPIVLFKYLVPGAVLDLLLLPWGERWHNYLLIGSIAAIAHLSKLGVNYVSGVVIGVPRVFLQIGLGLSTTTHALFGFLGGCLGLLAVQQLIKSGIVKLPTAEQHPTEDELARDPRPVGRE